MLQIGDENTGGASADTEKPKSGCRKHIRESTEKAGQSRCAMAESGAAAIMQKDGAHKNNAQYGALHVQERGACNGMQAAAVPPQPREVGLPPGRALVAAQQLPEPSPRQLGAAVSQEHTAESTATDSMTAVSPLRQALQLQHKLSKQWITISNVQHRAGKHNSMAAWLAVDLGYRRGSKEAWVTIRHDTAAAVGLRFHASTSECSLQWCGAVMGIQGSTMTA